MLTPRTDQLIDLALDEDAGLGDITSRAVFGPRHRSSAVIRAKQDLVICGLDVAARVFRRVDAALRVTLTAHDGEAVKAGAIVLRVNGPTIPLLVAERTALNFLQRLTGIATQASRYAAQVRGTGVRIVDTRKTTPGFRALEKYAVRCGGCFNHRASLGEHVLIKDNHIAAAGSLTKAVALCRTHAPHGARIEVEADSLEDVREALQAGAEIILLDNMSPREVAAAVETIAGRAMVEVSGGVRFETLREYALPGVNFISVGALTHSAPAADLSLKIVDRAKPRAKGKGSRKTREAR